MTILSDWIAFRDGEATFPEGYFETLITSHNSKVDIETIFMGLPNAEDAGKRVLDLLRNTTLGGFNFRVPCNSQVLAENEATEVLVKIGGALQGFLEEIGYDDLVERIGGLQLKVVEPSLIDTETNVMTNLEYEIYDAVGDAYLDEGFENFDVHQALYPAVYRLTNSPYVTRFIIDPVWPFKLDHQPFYELYLGGYIYFFTDNALLMSKHR